MDVLDSIVGAARQNGLWGIDPYGIIHNDGVLSFFRLLGRDYSKPFLLGISHGLSATLKDDNTFRRSGNLFTAGCIGVVPKYYPGFAGLRCSDCGSEFLLAFSTRRPKAALMARPPEDSSVPGHRKPEQHTSRKLN